jgi:Tol biopolymer transport system component
MVWLDREGRELGVIAPVQTTVPFPRLSPDESRVLLATGAEGDRDLYVFDAATGLERRLTYHKMLEAGGSWSPDSRTVYFMNMATYDVYELGLDGGSEPRRVATGFSPQVTPDGRELVYGRARGVAQVELTRQPVGGTEAEAVVVVDNPGFDWYQSVSPDGRWMVYGSTETGRDEVYLTSYPDGKGRWEISRGQGGSYPLWRDDMKEVFYTTHDAIWAVEVDLEGGVTIGRPRKLFDRPTTRWSASWPDGFDVTGDGRRFVLLRPSTRSDLPLERIVVVQNWIAEFAD